MTAPPPPTESTPLRPTAPARAAVALAGVGAAAAQVVVIRELLVASAGNELSIAAVLSAWLLWSAVGAWLGGRVAERSTRSPAVQVTVIAVVEVLVLALALGLARAGLHGLREIAGGALIHWRLVPIAGGTLSLPQLLILTTLVTAPAGLLLGWQFAAGCALLRDGTVAMDRAPTSGATAAYVADSLGHLAGGIVLSLAAVTRLPAEAVLIGAAAVVLSGAWLLQPTAARLVGGLALVVGLLLGAPAFREWTLALRWAPHRLVASLDGPYGNVAVLGGEGGELSYFGNGVHAFETGAALAGEQWVHLPLLAHAAPRRVLLIGGGPRTLREVLSHDPEHVAYFELDPTVLRAVRQHAPPALAAVLDDPRVEVRPADARLRLPALARQGERFDVTLVALGDPTTAQTNRYYTLHWFRQAQLAMAPEGLIAFQVMSSGDYLSRELRAYNACVYQTARRSGLGLSIFPGVHMAMIGARRPGATAVLDDAPALEARMASRGLDAPTLLASFYDALDPFRREDRLRELEQATDIRLNDDFTPTCYYYAQALWASWWRGATGAVLGGAERLKLGHVLASVGGLALVLLGVGRLGKRPWRVAAPYSLLVAGAGGMTLEVVLLLGLQSLYGYVYGMVGYAVGMLMAGLALGAWGARRWARGRGAAALAVTQLGLILAAACTALGLAAVQRLTPALGGAGWLPVALISLLMGLTGVAVGATFPCALRVRGDGHLGGATALYAVDLLGACGGALVAGLLLVPLLGIMAACGVVALAAASSALLAWTAGNTGEGT
ncbi:MAG: hypothetical protein FJX74_01560 [Armatimonadetes bacterium]|nr:hypothetical protein [Armatimonadota bacterium]